MGERTTDRRRSRARAPRLCVAVCPPGHFERGTQEMVKLVAASERGGKRRAWVRRRLGLTHTTTRAHHDSLDTGRARAARRTQCRHSASCDDYRRTSTTRRSLQHRAARHHTLHRQDSLGRTHAPVQRNRRYREARPKPRTMCCGRCHATRAAGPGAGRDD